jgi:CubicO group peptidase (beta-lactamase class C family)
MKTIINFLTILLITTQVIAKNNTKKYDKLLNELFDKNGPGGVALVVKDGKTLYRKAFGKANIELNVDMTPENIFRIGSITKQFTAAAILQLAESGKLDLNVDINEYIKDYAHDDMHITIKNLLSHTSGIKNYTTLKSFNYEHKKKDLSPQQLIDIITQQTLAFTPGEKYQYSNSNYVLLGYIIEQVSKQDYASYINQHIFQPLALQNSYYGSAAKIIHNRVSGYKKDSNGYKNADYISMSQPYAAGGLLSTVDDLSKWYTALMANQVFSNASMEEATTPFLLNNGSTADYGYSWGTGGDNIFSSPMISYGGAIDGFIATTKYLPKEALFVGILSNCRCYSPSRIANKLAAIAIGKSFDRKEIPVTQEELMSYEGIYESDSKGKITVIFENEKLKFFQSGNRKYPVFAYGKDKLFFKDDRMSLKTLHFNRNENGKITAITIKNTSRDEKWKKTHQELQRLTAVSVEESVLDTYVGKYELAENFYLHIVRQDNTLFAQAGGLEKDPLMAIAHNQFSSLALDIKITFNKDKNGNISSLTIHQNGEHEAKRIE